MTSSGATHLEGVALVNKELLALGAVVHLLRVCADLQAMVQCRNLLLLSWQVLVL